MYPWQEDEHVMNSLAEWFELSFALVVGSNGVFPNWASIDPSMLYSFCFWERKKSIPNPGDFLNMCFFGFRGLGIMELFLWRSGKNRVQRLFPTTATAFILGASWKKGILFC